MSKVSLSCDDLRLLYVAGPNSKERPLTVLRLMAEHEKSCGCSNSKRYRQDILTTPVTEELELAALDLIRDLCNRVELERLYKAFELGHELWMPTNGLIEGCLIGIADNKTGEHFTINLAI